jgi:hypothetical protein
VRWKREMEVMIVVEDMSAMMGEFWVAGRD